MHSSENNCHKFKQNHIEWSPEVGIWIRRRRLLNECLRFKLGKGKGSSNMFRKCKANEIGDPQIMTIDKLQAEMFICGKKSNELEAQAPYLRYKHLKSRLSAAISRDDKEVISAIKKIWQERTLGHDGSDSGTRQKAESGVVQCTL